MRELIISKNEEGQRLNKYLLKYLNAGTSSFIYKMLRKKNIVLNDKKASGNEILASNDSVKLYLSEETIEKFRNVSNITNITEKLGSNNIPKQCNEIRILYQDENILALHKPAGILSQKSDNKDYSINEYVLDYCKNNNLINDSDSTIFKPSVSNRLDRNTSGIILAGISLRGAQKLASALKSRDVDKYYYTIIKGKLKSDDRLKGYIQKDNNENVSTVISVDKYNKLSSDEKKNYSLIDTAFKTISTNGRYSLLKVKIYTGKSHQIRAHLASIGCNVVGDRKYGNSTVNIDFEKKYKLKYHLLHSGELLLSAEALGYDKNIHIIDEMPEIFERICKGEGIPWVPGIQED